MVKFQSDNQYAYSFHQCVVSPRLEDPPLVQNITKFNKNESIFFDWNVDTEFSLKECFKYDMALSKYLKEMDHDDKLESCISANYHLLKTVFIELASKSLFPQVALNDLQEFC
jgi:hypothetical protein